MLRNAAARVLLLAAALLAAAPARAVDCELANTYLVPNTFGTITAALGAVPPTLNGPTCITITNSAIYNEQVTVRNFITGVSSLTIQAAPGQTPIVQPPGGSNAAFQIFNDSVNVIGIRAQIINSMPYGVFVASSVVSLSDIRVNSGLSVTVAGVAMSSWTTLSNSFVNVSQANAVLISGTGNAIMQTTMTVLNANFETLHLAGASTNTISQSYAQNDAGTVVRLSSGGFNSISASTIAAPGTDPQYHGLHLYSASSNTFTNNVIIRQGPGGPRAVVIEGQSNGNSIVSSSITSSGMAIIFQGTSSNTVVGTSLTGASGVVVAGSTGTRLDSNRVIVTQAFGYGVRLMDWSTGLTVSRSTVTTAAGASGVYSHAFNAGALEVSNSFITGAGCAVCVETTTVGSTLYIASNTFVPGASATSQRVLLLDGLSYGATVQNNTISFRSQGFGAMTYRGMEFIASRGLVVERNRINQPGNLTTGRFIGAKFDNVRDSTFRFNDVHSSGPVETNSYMLDAFNSALAIRNNVFLSSMTGAGDVFINADGSSSLAIDYNSYYSSSGFVSLNLGFGISMFPWSDFNGQDRHSVNGNPQWANTSAGAEDFHPRSIAGRYNPATGLFVSDSVDSPVIDYGDTAESFANEPSPNGGAVNLGSYGNTFEASMSSPQPCIITRKVCKTGACPYQTIQTALNSIPNPLVAHSCVQFEDAGLYSQQVTIENFDNASSSITIRANPALGASRPYIRPSFGATASLTIRNSSVTIENVNVSVVAAGLSYGVLVSSPFVTITSMTVEDPESRYNIAGIALSSYSTISYSSVTMTNSNASGIVLGGEFSAVSYSTIVSNGSFGAALYIDGHSSNTVTRSLIVNNAGHSVRMLNAANGNSISFSSITTTANFYSAVYVLSSDSNTFTGNYQANPNGNGMLLNTAAKYNSVSLSTIASNSSNGAAFEIQFSSWNSSIQNYISNPQWRSLYLNNAHWNSISQSTITTANSTSEGAMIFTFADSNTVTGSYISNPNGWGAVVGTGSDFNTIRMSTMVSGAGGGFAALNINGASSNTVTNSIIQDLEGYGAYLTGVSFNNVISFSTVVSNDANSNAVYFSGVSSNTIMGSAVSNLSGSALRMAGVALNNTVYQCYLTAGASNRYALEIIASDTNTVTGSVISNPAGIAARLEFGADNNMISRSTITSAAAALPALSVVESGTNTITFSYIQGSTAAVVSGSTDTIISMNSMVATASNGSALAIVSGGGGISITSSTLRGGATGRGLQLDADYNAVVSIGSVTVTGTARGLEVSTQSSVFSLAVDSVTFRSMSAGSTGIHFIGGTMSSTLTLANFEDATTAVNVNAAALNLNSAIRMWGHYGARTGPAFETDPNNLVHWQAANYPGCVVTANVGVGQTYTTITAALDGIKATSNPLTGHTCVVLRNGGTYTETVTVEGFVNNGSSITILVDPAVSTTTTINAFTGFESAFTIRNASVSISGFSVVPASNFNYGIFVSSPNVTISSVIVTSGGGFNINTAGIAASSWTTIYNATVSVREANALLLPGSVGTTVSNSSMTNDSATRPAVQLANASSNTFTGVSMVSLSNAGALRIDSGGWNAVSLSIASSASSGYGLYITGYSTGNAISGTRIASANGYAARLENTGNNSLSGSTATTGMAAFAALSLSNASTNTFTGFLATNTNGHAGSFNTASVNNTVNISTFNSASFSEYALYFLGGSSSNTFNGGYAGNPNGTAVYIQNSDSNTLNGMTIAGRADAYGLDIFGSRGLRLTVDATGARFQGVSDGAVITGSTFTKSDMFAHALHIQDASNVTVTRSRMTNPIGLAMVVNSPPSLADYATITQSTLTSVSGQTALYLGGSYATLSSNYIQNGTGYALQVNNSSASVITLSTITNNNGVGLSGALYMNLASSNTISQSVIVNQNANAAFFENSSNWNTIRDSFVRGGANGIRLQTVTGLTVLRSTVTGGSSFVNAGIWANTGVDYTSILHSYVQGSTAVFLNDASRSVVNSNLLAASGGVGLYMSGGGVKLSMSSNTVLGGLSAGVAFDQNVSGQITLSTNTIHARSGPYAVAAVQLNAAATLWITSNTILPSLSASATTYGVYLDQLPGGATVQNNGIFYRTAGAAFNSLGAGAYGLFADNVTGLRVDHNRISNPGMVTSGNFIGAALSQSPNAMFKFNDLHATGAGLTAFHLLRVTNGANAVVRNNVFLSSMTTTLATNNRIIVVDLNSQTGFSSDYNTFYSSNSTQQGIWGTGGVSLLQNWVTVTGRDGNSLSANPLWLNAAGEDFHPLSRGGRFTSGGFVNDAVSGPGLDRGDPADSVVDESPPNLARANQGSYGQTAEASRSVLPCPLTVFVRQANDGDEITIQDAINGLPNSLNSHTCVVIGDSGIYDEQVTVQGFMSVNNSSMTIMMEPSLTVRPTVRGGFVIRNSSVNIVNVNVAPALALSYGIFASSANVTITSVAVNDTLGVITGAGVWLSSWSSVSNSSISVEAAHGLRFDGSNSSVADSTVTNNTAGSHALFFAGADSNTVTRSYMANPQGNGVFLYDGSDYNAISASTMTSGGTNKSALNIYVSQGNSVTGSYLSAVNGYGAFLDTNADYNTISFSTMYSAHASYQALYLTVADNNTVANSQIFNSAGTAAYLDFGSDYNTIIASTMTAPAGGTSALFVTGATHNTISSSAMTGSLGYGARFIGAANYNSILNSSATTNTAGFMALYLTNASSNTMTGGYFANPAGYAVSLESGANYNSIGLSTIASSENTVAGLSIFGSDFNTVSRSRISNPPGVAARIITGSDFNTIDRSTISSQSTFASALLITGGSSNTISGSYVQGSTAALVNGSTGTMINSSVFIATNTTGVALTVFGGAQSLALSSNTLVAGTQGIGLYMASDNQGAFDVSTNTISGGRYTVYIGTQQTGTTVWIASNTIVPLPSTSFISYGLYLNGLVTGANIQNNGIYYRSPGATAGFYTAAIDATTCDGLVIANNRISNPGMITGNALGIGLTGVVNTIFKYNDVHSTGTAIANAYHMRIIGSPGAQLRNNVFSSSWSVTNSTAALFVDANSQLGFSSDYNDFFSSNSFNSIEWGAGPASLPFPWTATTGTDGNSLAYHPRWKDVSPGVEDFHHLSHAGRWNGTAFVNDGFTSGLIDRADPADGTGSEIAPNGFTPNLGSYGRTAEASKSPSAPTGAAFAGIFTSSINVSYSLGGSDRYAVMATTAPNFAGTRISSESANGAAAQLAPQGLAANTTYYLGAGAIWGEYYVFGAQIATATLAASPAAALPDFAAVDISSVSIAWQRNGNPVDASTYTIVFTTGAVYPNSFAGNLSITTTPAGALPSATRTGLAQNTTYYAFGAALNWNSVPSSFTALGSTSTLADAPATAVTTFTAVNFSSLTVIWSANGNPLVITTYTVQLSTAADFNAGATAFVFSTAPAAGPSATFTGLAANEEYYFRARAVNHDGIPSTWTVLGSTITKPVTLQAPSVAGLPFVGVSSITATWSLSALATGYQLVASLTNDPTAVAASSSPVGINATTATVFTPALSANTTYFLFVRALGPGAQTVYSAFGSTATLAADPLTAVSTYAAVSVTSMTVTWLTNGNAVNVTSYTVVLSTGAAYPNAFAGNRVLSTAPAGAAPSASVGSLEDNTTYYLFVAAVNHNGIGSAFTALGSTITAIAPPATVYFDEISSTTIVASAYAPTPLFSNLGAGQSGTRVARNGTYQAFHGEAWSAATVMPAGRHDAAVAGFNNKIYVFGGFDGAAAQSTARVYDPATGIWTLLAPQPSARTGHAAAVASGKIYVLGGTSDGFSSLAANEEYDPAANAWTTKTALGVRNDHLSAVAVGDVVYAFGGVTDGLDNSKNAAYDPLTNLWTNKLDFPPARHQTAAAAAAGASGMTIVAAGGSGPSSGNFAYNAAANTWTAKTALPISIELGAAAALGGKIFVIGGAPARNTVYEFDPATNLWVARASMATGRAALAVAAAGGRVYAFGGTTDGGATSLTTAEEYDPGTATKFTGLQPNVQAGFKAQARNSVGTLSAETAVISTWTWAALPAAIASPFTVVETDSITVSWASNNNPGATEFKARASTSAAFAAGATISSSDWGVMNSTSALTLTPNTTYFLQSKARNGVAGVPGIETAWVPLGSTSTLAAVPAAAPVPFNTAANSLTVSWLANGNPVSVTSYTVVVTTENAYPNAHTGNVVAASTYPAGALPTATLSGLVANTTYFAFASAINHNGLRTAYAALGSTSTLALAPAAAGTAFAAVNQSSITFSWLANGNPIAVTTYSVVLTTSVIFPNTNASNVSFSTTPAGALPTATASTGVSPNTTYYAFAAAINWNGAVTAYSALGSTATLAAEPATVVSTFSAVNVSSLTVSWSASGNPLAITTYTVQLSTAADFNAFATSFAFATAPASGPSATFTGLADFTQYFFRVRALNHGATPTAWVALGSTTTLIAPLDAPTAPVFASVDITSITATWGLTPGATGYTFVASLLPANPPSVVDPSSTTFSINATTATVLAPALAANTTYFLFVRANGLLRSSPYAALGSTSTLTYAPATAVSTFTGIGITSFTVNWSANGNALAITTYTVQLSTAQDFNAFATSFTYSTAPAAGPSAMLTGLSGGTTYFLRIRSVNHNGVASAFVNLSSAVTVASPLFPTILDSQGGDAQWRRAGGTTYQVAFLDTSGAGLAKFQVKASTTAGGLGTDLIAFTDVVVGLSADEYNTPWALPAPVFNALLEGVTNYITVKVFNGPPLNNFTILQDAFFVQKDTTSPVMVDAQAGDAVVRSVAGTNYDVGVRDPSSGLAAFQYSASLSPGTANAAIIPWTDIAVVANTTGYSTPWPVNFPLLVSGVTNYISVRSWDIAGATTTLPDAFFVLKDTTGPSVAIAAPQNGGFHSALVTLSGTAASPVGVQGTEVSILDVLSGFYWNPAGPAFNSAAVIYSTAVGTTAWTLTPGINWVDGATYRAVARSSTTAGLYSTTYATATFVMDLSKPTVGVLAPVPDSIVAALPAISGTAADPAPNPSGLSSVEVRLRRNTDGFWWNWFTQAWSVTAVSSVTAGTTNWSLSPTPELKANLASGTSYFIAVRGSDNALPANQGDFFVSGATFTWQDTTPPSAIADLAAAHGTAPGSINLSWTARGDDGAAGIIAQGEYRVFYSTDIAAVPSTTTALVVISTAGVSPGALQFHTLAGLTPGVTYFVAVAMADGDYNWSLFSNQATTTSKPSPLNAITGHVVDIATQGITAVQIDCRNAAEVLVGTTFTLADGSGTFTVNSLPAGNYKLRVTYTVNGFSSAVWQDGIAMGSTNVDFVLEINYALATLTGTLSTLTQSSFGGGGLNAAAAVDSFIELHQSGRQVARATVQPGGRWTISGLLPGSYSVRAHTATGYTPFQDVQLTEGEVRVLGFVFDPLPTAAVFAFPNPARTSTTIRFESALAPLQATIHVFDIAGNLVKEIPDSQISRAAAPIYRVDWDLRNQSGQPVAPGVYHVMVKIRGGSDDQTATVIKKLAVVR